MSALRYGIAGTGMMGQEHMRNIALLPDASVAAVFEPDAAMRSQALGIAPNAAPAASFDALVRDHGIDCLLIASPNHCHVEQLDAALSARPELPILVEKPLFMRGEDGPRIADIAKAAPKVWVAMEYRYMPAIARLIEESAAATGGIAMLTIREHRFPFLPKVGHWNRFNRYTGGTLVEKCCHFFDLMRLLLGAEPVRVMASAGQAVNHLGETYNGERPDVWDCGYVIADFDNGTRAMLELCMFAEGSRYQEELSAVGNAGKIEAFVPGPTRFWPAELGEPPVAELIVSPRSPKGPRMVNVPVDPTLLEAGDHNGATFYQHQRFMRFARGDGPVEVSLRDGAAAVAMGLAAQRSAETGEAVRMSTTAASQPSRAA